MTFSTAAPVVKTETKNHLEESGREEQAPLIEPVTPDGEGSRASGPESVSPRETDGAQWEDGGGNRHELAATADDSDQMQRVLHWSATAIAESGLSSFGLHQHQNLSSVSVVPNSSVTVSDGWKKSSVPAGAVVRTYLLPSSTQSGPGSGSGSSAHNQ